MQLLFFSNVFPTPVEPTKGVFNQILVDDLRRATHNVEVVAPVPWTAAWRFRPPASKVARRDARISFPVFYFPPRVFRHLYHHFLWASVRRTLRPLLRKQRPDAILAYWAHPDGAVALRAAREVGVPTLLIVGGSDILLLAAEPSRRAAILAVLNGVDVVLAVGGHLRDRLLEMGTEASKVHVLRRGVDATFFRPGPRDEARRRLGLPALDSIVLWVGRMVPVKGLDVLLQAWEQVAVRGSTLYLVGEGPLEASLRKRVESASLSSRVRFVGSVAHDALPDWYRAADLTVLPSHSEGTPNVLLESLACGTPFLASRVGRNPRPDGRSRRGIWCRPETLRRLPPPSRSVSPRRWKIQRSVFGSPAIRQPPSLRSSKGCDGRPPGQAPMPERKDALRQILRWGLGVVLPRKWFLTHGPRSSATVCLTFDDGPDPEHTPRLLDALAAASVPATFFVIGGVLATSLGERGLRPGTVSFRISPTKQTA